MNLWLLRPNNNLKYDDDPWEPWYDKVFGFVVRAESENDARIFASRDCGDEREDVWLDHKYSTCEELTSAGNVGVIIRAYAGA